MRAEYDAVIVGSGPNGLVAAALLSQNGWRVLVVEAAERIGGGTRTEELTLPGFRHDVCSSVHPLAMASEAFRGLALEGRGLQWVHPELPLAHPLDGEPAVLLHRDVDATAEGLGDGARSWKRMMTPGIAAGLPLIDGLLSPLSFPKHPLTMARFGAKAALPATALARARLTGGRAQALFGGLSAHSILDLHSPMTGGYGLMLGTLAHLVGWPVAVGGSQAIADALASHIRGNGGEVVTGHRVGDLASLPSARATILDLTPRQLLGLQGTTFPARYRRGLESYRYGPGVFKLDWALDGPVPWKDPQVGRAATVHLGGSLAEVAHGEREVARGRHSDKPFVLFVQASVADPSRAPAGKQTGWAYCHVPNGSTVDMTAAIEDQVERFAPGFRELVIGRNAMSPTDLEAHNANEVGGDIAGGAGDVGQFFARPVLSRQPWRTPMRGVYLCSASTPPGGGVHGMGGWHAARLVLKQSARQ